MSFDMQSTSSSKFFYLLKALWGGHTAALQFMLGMQLQAGERKHAMRDRRFARRRHHEDMHALYLAASVSYTYLCDVGMMQKCTMMHAVVFADRAPEAKNSQVICENQNSKGLKKRKNSDRNGQKSDKSK